MEGAAAQRVQDPAAFAELVLRLAAHVATLPEASRPEGISAALAELGTAVGADRAYTFTLVDQDGVLRNDHEWCAPGIGPVRDNLQAVPFESAATWWPRFERDEAVVIPSVSALDPATHPEVPVLSAQGVRSLLAVPIRRDDRTVGFVGFDAVRRERAWSDHEVRALRVAAHLISATEALTVAARQRDEVTTRLAQLANQLPGALFQFELTPDGGRRFSYTSPRFQTLLGIDGASLQRDGRPALERVHPDDRPAFEAALRHAARQHTRWDLVFRVMDITGRVRTIRGRAEPSGRDGGGVVFHGVLHDVTDELRRQRALERAAAFRRSLLTLTHDLLARDVAEDLYRSVLAHAVAHVPGADAGSVIVRGVDGNYRVEAAQGYDLEVLRRIVLAPAEVGGRGATDVELVTAGTAMPRLTAAKRRALQSAGGAAELRGTLCVPVSVHGEIAALLHLDATERPDAFDDDAVESGTLIGGLLGALLQRLSLESELKSERSKLDHMAHHDPLTGLPNRILLGDRLAHALERDRRSGHATALLVVDLDGFKSVNDTFGHATGDRLLAVLGSRLREALRTEDTVARIGGDEFAVVASGLVDPAAARVIAQKVAAAFDAPIDVAGRVVGIGGSIGVSIAPQDGDDAGTLLKNADLAMYRVKREGRGAIAFFTHDLDARMRARTLLTEDLRAALQAGELHLAYQVRVRLGDGSAVGVEALARWDHPRLGAVPPSEFVPLAEEAGLAEQLGAFVLGRACAEMATWRRQGRAATWRVAVNVSPHQLRSGDLDAVTLETLARHGLPATALELEVTEGTMLDERPQVLASLQRLRRAGVRVAMDDFGTGYSSLHRLTVLPVDTLKIDRSFVAGLGRDPRDAAVVDAVIALAHGLGLEVVAEGVETEAQRSTLQARGCHLGQGFLFAAPLPVDAFWRRFADA
jgi:diguanylate cyclase (GGDEF)-like protein